MDANKKIDSDKHLSELESLRQDYIERLPKKLSLLKDVWKKLSLYSWSDEAFLSLQRLVHSLAGSGKTFGFGQLSIEANKFEEYVTPLVMSRSIPTDKERRHIEQLLENITSTNENPLNPVKDVVISTSSGLKLVNDYRADKTIYVVDDDEFITSYLNTLLSSAGYKVRTFPTPGQAVMYVDGLPPDLVIMDIVFPGQSKSACFDSVSEICDHAGKRIPFVFISARTDLSARTKAIRSGGDAYFTKPLDFPLLLEKLEELTEADTKIKQKVLIVDDDPGVSQINALFLEHSGIETCVVNKPIQVIKKIEEFKPDLVLMDYLMPEYNGLELSAVIRQESKYAGLPIVFLSSESDAGFYEKVLDLGVSSFLVKPVSLELLSETVSRQINLARRVSRNIQKVSKLDSVSGLCNRHYFLEQLELSLSSAIKSDRRQALLDLSIDNIQVLKDEFGIEWLENTDLEICKVIRSIITSNDIATNFCDATYYILVDYRTESEIIELADLLRHNIRSKKIHDENKSIRIECSITAIQINEHVSSIHDFLQFAEDSISLVRRNNTKKVCCLEYLPQSVKEALGLKERFKKAMEDKSFQLAYQPIITVDHRNYEMYEVLIRMIDGAGEILSPAKFMSSMSSKELLIIDRWVIENAIESLSLDKHARRATDFFIKVTSGTLHDATLIPSVSNSLTEGGIVGESRVVFLATEKDIIDNDDLFRGFSEKIKKLQCGIGIDHFGSTDSYEKILQTIKPDYVKLCGSVMKNIMADKAAFNYVMVLINTALTYDVKIIASTIEDPATISALWNMGVRYFQGYFIKEPDSMLNFDFTDVEI